jgi:pimeloyl-ACP methyl ester carboxylesterase
MHRAFVPTLAAVALLLAACSAGGTSSPTAPEVTTAAPAVEPTASTSAEATRSEVTFVTSDGLTLEGTVFGDGSDWVILAHMLPADQTSWFEFANAATRQGFAALTFNFRGYGGSDGPREPFAVDVDVEAAIDFAEAAGAQRIWLIGASMGGSGSLAVAARRDVVGVATLSAPAQFQGTDALGAVPGIAGPKLFVAARGDEPYASTVGTFLEAAAEPKSSRLFDGSAHGTNLFETHGQELTMLLLEFLAA